MKMSFLGAVGLLIVYLVYKDNREQINEHVRSKIRRKDAKDFEKSLINDVEQEKKIHDTIMESGDKVQIALYLQQQALLSALRSQSNEIKIDPFHYSSTEFRCATCGEKLDSGMKFCPKCGTPLTYFGGN